MLISKRNLKAPVFRFVRACSSKPPSQPKLINLKELFPPLDQKKEKVTVTGIGKVKDGKLVYGDKVVLDENSEYTFVQRKKGVSPEEGTGDLYMPPPNAPADASPNQQGIVLQMPEKLLNRPVRIYQKAKNPNLSGVDRISGWRLYFEPTPVRTDPLTGRQESTDPTRRPGGLMSMKFPTMEAAKNYIISLGFKNYFVDKTPYIRKEYEYTYKDNFLKKYIQKRIKTWTPEKIATQEFRQAERGRSCWVNVKHTNYGPTDSKTVSQTQWQKGVPNPIETVGHWANDTILKYQDSFRRYPKF